MAVALLRPHKYSPKLAGHKLAIYNLFWAKSGQMTRQERLGQSKRLHWTGLGGKNNG